VAGHDEAAVVRHLRTQVGAVGAPAPRWESCDAVPEGFRCAWDVAVAATEPRRALKSARRS
jgi:hypothetical protein